jgi:glycosyltransferase involved in cell wall biosynthesis
VNRPPLEPFGITPATAFQESDTLPLVSCICLTYNRPPHFLHLVEEAIESFLRQTYPRRELIVFNDCAEQELVCNAPGVKIVNSPERIPALGDKHNAAIQQSSGDLIAPWDDDDISLPWRLTLSVERLGSADYFNPRAYWFLDASGYHFDHPVGYAHTASIFTRAAFEAVGGYPSVKHGQDGLLDGVLRQRQHVVDPERGAARLSRGEWFYVYRWGVSPVHLSSNVDPDFYTEIGARPVEPGQFLLRPHWRRDYEGETRALVDA